MHPPSFVQPPGMKQRGGDWSQESKNVSQRKRSHRRGRLDMGRSWAKEGRVCGPAFCYSAFLTRNGEMDWEGDLTRGTVEEVSVDGAEADRRRSGGAHNADGEERRRGANGEPVAAPHHRRWQVGEERGWNFLPKRNDRCMICYDERISFNKKMFEFLIVVRKYWNRSLRETCQFDRSHKCVFGPTQGIHLGWLHTAADIAATVLVGKGKGCLILIQKNIQNAIQFQNEESRQKISFVGCKITAEGRGPVVKKIHIRIITVIIGIKGVKGEVAGGPNLQTKERMMHRNATRHKEIQRNPYFSERFEHAQSKKTAILESWNNKT